MEQRRLNEIATTTTHVATIVKKFIVITKPFARLISVRKGYEEVKKKKKK